MGMHIGHGFTELTRRVGLVAPRGALSMTFALALAAACGDGAPAPESPAEPEESTTAAGPTENTAAGQEEAAGPSSASDSFSLVASPAEGYRNGELSQFSIHLEGRNDWHVNLEYPFSIEVGGEGISYPATALDRSHTSQFAEEGVHIDVPFTPTRVGEVTTTALVRFAMCNPSNCVPEERRLALSMAVE